MLFSQSIVTFFSVILITDFMKSYNRNLRMDVYISCFRVVFIVCLCFSDFLFKFLVIGNAGTGKSCLLHQFIEKKCKWHQMVTVSSVSPLKIALLLSFVYSKTSEYFSGKKLYFKNI